MGPLIKEGLDEEDFNKLEIQTRGERKKLKFYLSQITPNETPFKFKFFPISTKEISSSVQLHDPNTLMTFLLKRFKEFPPALQALKVFHQAVVVSFLGHLGESVFYNSGLRFKDVKGSWKIIITYNQGYQRNNRIPFISITHRRKEMVLSISENKRLTEMFSFEWEVEIQFTNLELDDLHSIRARLIGFDWNDGPKKDATKEEKEVLEKNISSVFCDLNIQNSILKPSIKKKDEEKKKKTGSTFGFWSSQTEDHSQKQ